jgi:uncharacterized protein (DUF433 family)
MTLAETLIAEPPPLTLRNGVLFVTGTRVPIDTIIAAYEQGSTPEEIGEYYDAVRLEDIYGVLRYYLKHRTEVEAYLRERRATSREARQRMTPLLPSRDLADRLAPPTPDAE